MEREKRRFFVYRSPKRITLYKRRYKIASLDTIVLLDTYKQPLLTKY